jgi:hypothetical protein
MKVKDVYSRRALALRFWRQGRIKKAPPIVEALFYGLAYI